MHQMTHHVLAQVIKNTPKFWSDIFNYYVNVKVVVNCRLIINTESMQANKNRSMTLIS